MEPIEQLIIDVPGEYQGVIIEKLAKRKGELRTVENSGATVVRIEFEIPTRGLIGYRSEFLTDTRGLGIMSSRFIGYGFWRGEIASRNRGSLVSIATGPTTAYSIEALQERSVIFVEPMERVYTGQIVGENSRTDDMECNPTKRKHLTNHRSSTKDIAVTHRGAAQDVARAGHGMDRGRRARGNHPEGDQDAQGDPGRPAEKARAEGADDRHAGSRRPLKHASGIISTRTASSPSDPGK